MSSRKAAVKRASDLLEELLQAAVESGVARIDVERVPEGLEIVFVAGSSGLGRIIQDRELESKLIQLIISRSGLEDNAQGKMEWRFAGKVYVIKVEQYESFGEWCCRLKIQKPKNEPKGSGNSPEPEMA